MGLTSGGQGLSGQASRKTGVDSHKIIRFYGRIKDKVKDVKNGKLTILQVEP